MKVPTIWGSWIQKSCQHKFLTPFCVPKRVFFCEKKPFYLKASLRAFSKRVFFHKNKIPFTRLKSLFFNTFSPFSINLEPKRGMLLLFWCFLKLLAVVDHSQMRSWGNFFLSERSVNVHWTHTIPAAGMVWQHLRKLFSNFFNNVGYCLCSKLVWTFLQRRIQVLSFKRQEFLGLFVKNSSMDYAFIFFAFVNGQEKFDPSLWKAFSLYPF